MASTPTLAATTPSPRHRPSFSIDLPAPEFSHHVGQALPTTPRPHDELDQDMQPPPRPDRDTYPTYKIRRRRRATQPSSDSVNELDLPDMPMVGEDMIIPTIETSGIASLETSPLARPIEDGRLSPLPIMHRFFTPPRTPEAQIDLRLAESDDFTNEWGMINDSQRPGFERGGSVGSGFSDSSMSSYGSSSAMSFNVESCTSPITDADPFVDREDESKPEEPANGPFDHRPAKRIKRNRRVKWTAEMDKHLETTFVMHIQDPRVTPFKTLPGVPPPLGVCHRVATKARKGWPTFRGGLLSQLEPISESTEYVHHATPETIRASSAVSSCGTENRLPSVWPRSDSATRRRLRYLVKHKPSLSAYYTRLMHNRSVSPFTGSFVRSSSPMAAPRPPFSGTDLHVALVASTSASMQPEGPLAQLALAENVGSTDRLNPPAAASSAAAMPHRPDDWFARITRSQAQQQSASLQSQLNLAPPVPLPTAQLASPFDEISQRTRLLRSMDTTSSLGRRAFQDGTRPALQPAFEGAPTAPRSLKRRFKSDEEKPRRPGLESVFGVSSQDEGAGRSRGYSVGAVRATSNLARLFDPPAPQGHFNMSLSRQYGAPPSFDPFDHAGLRTPQPSSDTNMGEASDIPLGSRSAPRRLAEPIPRLRSPFMAAPTVPHPPRLTAQPHTFPRRAVQLPNTPASFRDRLLELGGQLPPLPPPPPPPASQN